MTPSTVPVLVGLEGRRCGEMLAASAGTTPTTPMPDATNSDVRATLLNDAVFRRPSTFSIINPPGVRARPVRVPTVGRTDATTLWAGLPGRTPQRRGEATPELEAGSGAETAGP